MAPKCTIMYQKPQISCFYHGFLEIKYFYFTFKKTRIMHFFTSLPVQVTFEKWPFFDIFSTFYVIYSEYLQVYVNMATD